MQTVDEQLMTVVEVAELLRVSPSTVRRWVREGDVPAFRIGGRRLGIRRSELDQLRAKMLAERGGVPFSPPAWELINEARDERTEQLP